MDAHAAGKKGEAEGAFEETMEVIMQDDELKIRIETDKMGFTTRTSR